eukprot:m.294560 g.294560  ORF g.294560 m.294560 type:complete len:1550 (+) comp19504_c0_seq2:170-4819(+)
MANPRRSKGLDDLLVAAERGDTRTVVEILNTQQCDVNCRDVAGYTPLHYAASGGHQDTVALLLEHGADVNAVQPTKGQTPLHCACNSGHVAVVQRLLQRPEAINSINSTTKHMMCTPLHCCAFSGATHSVEIAELLLAHGALVDQRDTAGQTPLVYSARKGLFPELVQKLVDAGADPAVMDNKRISIMHYAAATPNSEVVRLLLAAGASPHGSTGKSQPLPPLHIAARQGFFDSCLALLRGGASVNEASAGSKTALYLAVQSGEAKIVELFAKTGADLNAKDANNHTALGHAASMGLENIVNILLNMGADPNIATARHGWTPLHLAAKAGHHLTLSLLLNCPRTDVNALDKEHRSALHWAAFRGDTGNCILLVENDVAVATKDAEGHTAGDIATLRQHLDTHEELTKRGCPHGVTARKKTEELSSYWVDDSDAPACFGCRRRFTMTLRRHHCRECCGVFCKQCTQHRLPPPHRLAKLRICDECYRQQLSGPSNQSVAVPSSLGPPQSQRQLNQSEQPQHTPTPKKAQQQQRKSSPVDLGYLKEQRESLEAGADMRKGADNRAFYKEFSSFASVGRKNTTKAARLPENLSRNRYTDIVPYDKTRVYLSNLFHGAETDYINASYVHGFDNPRAYIASQGPLPHTLHEFWQMVWEQECGVIVMVTGQIERGKVKCHQYWPSSSSGGPSQATYGDFTVSLLSTDVHDSYVLRRLQIQAEGCVESTREVMQFAFTQWPDHGVPTEPGPLLEFHRACQQAFRESRLRGPPVIHCSAGVGRSGTFIVLDRIAHLLAAKQTVDIPTIIRDLRQCRMLLVQAVVQYIFIWRAAVEMIDAFALAEPAETSPRRQPRQQFGDEEDLMATAMELSMAQPRYMPSVEQEDEQLRLALALSMSEQESESGSEPTTPGILASPDVDEYNLPQQFSVQYLGSQRISASSGPPVKQAMTKIQARCKQQRPLHLTLAYNGVELSELDSATGSLYPLRHISYCQCLPNPPMFAFVTLHPGTGEHICHTFRCPTMNVSKKMTTALSNAFRAAAAQRGLHVPAELDDPNDPELALALLKSQAETQKRVVPKGADDQLALALARSAQETKQPTRSSSEEELQLAMALSQSLAEQQGSGSLSATASSSSLGGAAAAVPLDASNPFAAAANPRPTAATAAPTQVWCQGCDEPLEPNAQFCGECGAVVKPCEPPAPVATPEAPVRVRIKGATLPVEQDAVLDHTVAVPVTTPATGSGAAASQSTMAVFPADTAGNPFFSAAVSEPELIEDQPNPTEPASEPLAPPPERGPVAGSSSALGTVESVAGSSGFSAGSSNPVAGSSNPFATVTAMAPVDAASAAEPTDDALPTALVDATQHSSNPFFVQLPGDNDRDVLQAADPDPDPDTDTVADAGADTDADAGADESEPGSGASSSTATSGTTSTGTPSPAPDARGVLPTGFRDDAVPVPATEGQLPQGGSLVGPHKRGLLSELDLGRERSLSSQDIRSEADRMVHEAKERLKAARQGSGVSRDMPDDAALTPPSPIRAPVLNAPFSSPSLLLGVTGQPSSENTSA